MRVAIVGCGAVLLNSRRVGYYFISIQNQGQYRGPSFSNRNALMFKATCFCICFDRSFRLTYCLPSLCTRSSVMFGKVCARNVYATGFNDGPTLSKSHDQDLRGNVCALGGGLICSLPCSMLLSTVH